VGASGASGGDAAGPHPNLPPEGEGAKHSNPFCGSLFEVGLKTSGAKMFTFEPGMVRRQKKVALTRNRFSTSRTRRLLGRKKTTWSPF